MSYYREHGFRYALDDVGEGYNTIEMLIALKPDFVKLDMKFVQGVADSVEKQQSAQAILEAAKQVGATPLAEGIERYEDLICLRDMGYELFQGYFIGKPNVEPIPQQLMDEHGASVRI